MKKFVAVLALFVMIGLTSIGAKPAPANDNLLLLVTKENKWDAHLQWINLDSSAPYIYCIYRSEDPSLPGNLIATVHGDASGGNFTDINALQGNFKYFYKVYRVNQKPK